MTEVILGQLRFILWMMCGGMAILAGYDVLRLFRWLVPHGAVWIAVEDLFFWGAASVPAFILFLKMHDGQIRWYGVVALLSGIVLYEVGISRPGPPCALSDLRTDTNKIAASLCCNISQTEENLACIIFKIAQYRCVLSAEILEKQEKILVNHHKNSMKLLYFLCKLCYNEPCGVRQSADEAGFLNCRKKRRNDYAEQVYEKSSCVYPCTGNDVIF